MLIIHLADHDPSGMDMSRDNNDRLDLFAKANVKVERIALNMDQIEKFDPPPNPAKLTDSRSGAYVAEFGRDSWELDALEPKYIADLIKRTLHDYIDFNAWDETEERVQEQKKTLSLIAKNYYGIKDWLSK